MAFAAVPTGILYWKGYSEPDKDKQYIAHIGAVATAIFTTITVWHFAKWLQQ
jgi:hypothetical protein